MRKKMLFSMMFMAGITGGFIACPTPVMASVSQSQTLKVSGQRSGRTATYWRYRQGEECKARCCY